MTFVAPLVRSTLVLGALVSYFAPAIATPQKNDGLPPVAFKRIEDWRSLMIIAILTTG